MASLVVLLLAVVVAAGACTGDSGRDAADAEPAETMAYADVDGRELLADVYRPTAPAGSSVVILHGQGGDRTSVGSVALAEGLRAQGVVVVIADYDTATPQALAADQGVGLAQAAGQARCAIDLARSEAISPTRTVVVGESAGGLVGFVAATGADAGLRATTTVACRATDESQPVDALVSWNGAIFIFHPRSPFHDPSVWTAMEPDVAVAAVPDLELWFGLGGEDDRTPTWHVDLVTDFAARSDRSTLTVLPSAGHTIPTAGDDLDALVALVATAALGPTDR